MKKNLLLSSAFSLISLFGYSQCATYTSAVSDVTLQCTSGTANRTAVAYYPTKNMYYSVNAGSNTYPIETFTATGGAALSSIAQGADYRGFWYNPNLGKIEGNTFSGSGIFDHDINPATGYAMGTTANVGSSTMPNSQSAGTYDPVNNHVLYYNSLTLYKYNRTTNAVVGSMAITGLPATSSINSYGLLYTGIPGSEVGVYDYTNKAVYFINYTTGAYVSTCQLPVSAPAASSFKFSYANNRIFLYDGSGNWFGYKITNQSDLLFAGNNISCSGQSVTITVSGASTYTWGTGSNAVSISVTPTATTIYSVSATNSLGCTNSSNFVVSLGTTPSLSATASGTLFCGSANASLTASGATTYSWNTGASSSSISVTPSTTTVYSVTGFNSSGCSAVSTLTVNVETTPTVNILGTYTICEGSSATFTATGANTYTWNTGSNGQTITVSPTVNTTYTLGGSSANGCGSNVSSITVTVEPSPTLSATSSSSLLCSGQTATLTANGATTYSWSQGGSSSISTISPTITTTYTVTGTNTIGCSSTATITQNVSPCTGIETVNNNVNKFVIYPNPGQGIFNLIYSGNVSNAFVHVYDVTGKLVLTEKLTKGKNTIYMNSCESGVYTAIISAEGETSSAAKIIKQ